MAVFTHVSHEDLDAFVADYNFGELLSFSGIAEGAENSNFLLRATTGSFILTIFERRVNPDDLPFFLGLMDHLASAGIPCPVPVKDKDGRVQKNLCGKPAAVVSFLDGEWPRAITPTHCAEFGATLATFHNVGLTYGGTRQNDLSLNAWVTLNETIGQSANQIEPELNSEIHRTLESITAAWPGLSSELPQGIIHGDLFPDNVFFLNGRCTGLIDFYFACSDTLAYDIAICLNAWCFDEDETFNTKNAMSLISGYESVRTLTDEENAAMPILLQGGAMRFLLTRLYDWINAPTGARIPSKDPREYLHKLRFHQSIDDPTAYGLRSR